MERETPEQRDIVGEVGRLKSLLSQATPVWVDGNDFKAFNYGDESQTHSMAGMDSRMSSDSSSAVLSRETGEWHFKDTPLVRLAQVSHVPHYDKAQVDVTFQEVRDEIEKSKLQ